jgi:hypothetical protein
MLSRVSIVLAAALMALPCGASDLVDLSVITSRGYVTYTVPGEWKVLDMQTKAPKTAAVFQIKNPADEGTPDSTNVSILTFEMNSPEATATFDKMVSKQPWCLASVQSRCYARKDALSCARGCARCSRRPRLNHVCMAAAAA